jgi:acyl carrier protein
MTSPVFERVRGIAADVLQVSASQITPESSPDTIGTWDSVHHLNLILALEQEFDRQFDPEEIDKMTSIERILEVVGGKVQQG